MLFVQYTLTLVETCLILAVLCTSYIHTTKVHLMLFKGTTVYSASSGLVSSLNPQQDH